MEPISTLRNILILSIIFDIDVPDNKYVMLFTRMAADAMGLFEYKECECHKNCRTAWKEIVFNDAPVLSGMLNFPNGKEYAVDPNQSIYMTLLWGVIIPERDWCTRNYRKSDFEVAEYWKKRYERANHLHTLYDLLDDLSRPIPLWRKRIKLGKIRELIGDEWYNNGVVPGIVD